MPGARRGVARQPGRAPWHRPCTSHGPASGTETYATRSFRRPLEPIALGRSVGREKSRQEHVTMNNSSDAVPDVSLEVDRKSTRLNSSHLVISYAVFCLKKKKAI